MELCCVKMYTSLPCRYCMSNKRGQEVKSKLCLLKLYIHSPTLANVAAHSMLPVTLATKGKEISSLLLQAARSES